MREVANEFKRFNPTLEAKSSIIQRLDVQALMKDHLAQKTTSEMHEICEQKLILTERHLNSIAIRVYILQHNLNRSYSHCQ